ncbi:MAG: hypothetical protein KUG72_09635 [Pseudomonadales bacterium]|nr:hypothetical protein [Pseudomonadales bacterium]
MNTKTKPKLVEREWPAKYGAVVEELRVNEALLDELLDDHARLVQAVAFWRKKSPDKAEEFKDMVDELEIEITALIKQKLC